MYKLALDIREVTTLTKRLCEWLSAQRGRRCVSQMYPHDYTIHDAFKRSHHSIEFLQHLYTLCTMRQSFFMRESPIWHCMEIVLEWTQQNVYEFAGLRKRWVFKKHCAEQDRRDAQTRTNKRKFEQLQRTARVKQLEEKRQRTREEKEYIRYLRTKIRKMERFMRVASKLQYSARLWSDKDRQRLLDRISNASLERKHKMFEVLDFYGTDIDPQEWTTQTCRHVSKIIGRPRIVV